MKNIWETCTFSDEITSPDFNKAKFAVELHQFLDNTAGPVYQDPQLFFENTFPTDQMKLLVKDSLVRLESGKGQSATVINTGFGGGKTHSIMLLHHIINNPTEGLEFIKKINLPSEYGVEKIPKAKMIAIDCRKISKNTLWGEIAEQLGQYENFKEFDAERKAPTDISTIKALFEQPTLLLIDEVLQYIAKVDAEKIGNRTLGELTIVFLLDLISAVDASTNSCLILTSTDKQKLYEGYDKELLSKIKTIPDHRKDELGDKFGEAISRQTQVITPVERNQIYDVVRSRLVRQINSEEKEKTVREYFQYYKDNGIVLDADFEEKLQKSYPFHPSLIDTLYDRVSTIPKFNQTRGMLRLLARVIRQIKEEKKECKLLGLGDIPLDNHEVADELTARLDLNLRQVIDTDCNEHAKKLDESKTVKIVEPIARTIYVFSLHGDSKKSGIKRCQIKLAIGRPGLEPSLVDKALDDDILKNFWYIHDKDKQEFYFIEFPNINLIIHEHKNSITPNQKRKEIKNALNTLLSSRDFSSIIPIIWDEHELDDTGDLKIFIVDYAKNLSDNSARDEISRILDRTSSGGIRSNKNTIVFVYADQDYVPNLERQAEQLIAVKNARKDERIQVNDAFLKDIGSKETSATTQLERDCMTTYCKIGYPYGPNPRLDEIRFMESKKNILTDAVIELLERKGKLVVDINVDGIEVPDETKKVNSIYKSFRESQSKPFLLHPDSFAEAIKEGTRQGKFGFCSEIAKIDDKFVAEINKECFGWEGYLVNKDKIHHVEVPEEAPSTASEGIQETFESNLFRYQIDFDEYDSIQAFVNKIGLLNLNDWWKSSQKKFNAKVNVGDTTMSIESSLSDYMMLKGILNSIASKDPTGTGYLTISSEKDLQEEFNETEIDARVI